MIVNKCAIGFGGPLSLIYGNWSLIVCITVDWIQSSGKRITCENAPAGQLNSKNKGLFAHLPTGPSPGLHSRVWSVLGICWRGWPRRPGWVWGSRWWRQSGWRTVYSRAARPAAAWPRPSSSRPVPERHTGPQPRVRHTHAAQPVPRGGRGRPWP